MTHGHKHHHHGGHKHQFAEPVIEIIDDDVEEIEIQLPPPQPGPWSEWKLHYCIPRLYWRARQRPDGRTEYDFYRVDLAQSRSYLPAGDLLERALFNGAMEMNAFASGFTAPLPTPMAMAVPVFTQPTDVPAAFGGAKEEKRKESNGGKAGKGGKDAKHDRHDKHDKYDKYDKHDMHDKIHKKEKEGKKDRDKKDKGGKLGGEKKKKVRIDPHVHGRVDSWRRGVTP